MVHKGSGVYQEDNDVSLCACTIVGHEISEETCHICVSILLVTLAVKPYGRVTILSGYSLGLGDHGATFNVASASNGAQTPLES